MFVWFLGLIGWIVGSFMVGQIVFWIGLLIMPIFSALLVYFDLAPRDMIFSFVKEGTGIIVMRGGKFDKIIISWRGHAIDTNTWDVVEVPDTKISFFGGLEYWGIPPFQKIGHYQQRWSHLLEDGTVKSHDEELYYVLLKTDYYVFELPITKDKSAEDINGIPIHVKLVVPMRIVNPFEALFRPQRWLAAISGTIKPTLKRFVAKFRYKEDLLDMRAGSGIEKIQKEKGIVKRENEEIVSENNIGDDLKNQFWQELKRVFPEGQVQREGEDDECLRIYGVLLEKRGTDIFEIDTSEEYKKMVTAEYEAKQKAKMIMITGDAEGKAITNRITTPVWSIAKQLAGIIKPDAKLTKKDRKKISSFQEEAWSNLLESKAIEAIKPRDKIIITEGKGVGKTVARDTAREAVREEISERNREEEEAEHLEE